MVTTMLRTQTVQYKYIVQTCSPSHLRTLQQTFDCDEYISGHHPFTVLSYAAILSSISHCHWTNGKGTIGEDVVRVGERPGEHSLPEDGGGGVTGGCAVQSNHLPNNDLHASGWDGDDGRGGVGDGVCSAGERGRYHHTFARTHTHTHTHTHSPPTLQRPSCQARWYDYFTRQASISAGSMSTLNLSYLCDIPYMDVAWRLVIILLKSVEI